MILQRLRLEGGLDDQLWRTEPRAEDVEIEAPLTNGADDTGENLLRRRATRRAIPATDVPIHDGWADRVFGAPVGRIDARVSQEGQERRILDVEMGGR